MYIIIVKNDCGCTIDERPKNETVALINYLKENIVLVGDTIQIIEG